MGDNSAKKHDRAVANVARSMFEKSPSQGGISTSIPAITGTDTAT